MTTKFYRYVGQGAGVTVPVGLGKRVTIKSFSTKVEDEEIQEKIEGLASFGRKIVECKRQSEVVEEAEEEIDSSPGTLGFGLHELKDMHIATLRGVTKRANKWAKGMNRDEMIAALIGG